jgi:pilus assembly protein CpaB
MKRRRIFLLIFAILVMILIVGLIALGTRREGGLTSLFQGSTTSEEPSSATPQPEATPEVELKEIVVALQTIPRGMTVPLEAVEIRGWPVDELPEGVETRLENVVGRVARVDIIRQRPVLKSALADVTLGSGAEMALSIPKGKVAYAFPVQILSAVANALRPGDRVDVLVSFSLVEVDQDTQIKQPLVRTGGEDCLAGCQVTGEQLPRLVSQYSVQNATVLAVGLWQEELPELPVPAAVATATADDEVAAEEEATPPAPEAPTVAQAATQLTSITLIVSPQDALVLKWALETNASIDLVMRSAVDQDIYAQPEAVTLQYMLDRFEISVPPKLPQAPENEFDPQYLRDAQENAPIGGE